MRANRIGKRTAIGWGLSAAFSFSAAILSGCGDKKAEDDAIVTTAPGETNVGGSSSNSSSTKTGPAAQPDKAAEESKPAEATVKAEGWGTLKGKVVFEGDPPQPKILVGQGDKSKKDPTVCAVHEIRSQRLVVDPKTKGVKFALIYIPKPTAVNPEALSAAKNAKPVFDQKNCVFEPHVLAVLAGTTVEVQSKDPVSHNVNSKVQNNAFNYSLTSGGKKDTPVNPTRAPGKIVCDIHDWMSAYWYVSESPYFAVTGDDGSFELKNVPAGTQKVVVWQESTGLLTPTSGVAVNIKPNDTVEKTFSITPDKVKPE